MLIEVRTYRLLPEVADGAFIEADQLLQQRLSSVEGFVRRTTARRVGGGGGDGGGGDGGRGERAWLELTLWASAARADDDGVLAARAGIDALVDPASASVERFESLD